MISVLTPRIQAVIDNLTQHEATEMLQALETDNDNHVWSMLAAKDFMILNEADPLLSLLFRDDLQWGDVMLALPAAPKAPKVVEYKEIDPDAHWVMPALRLRKHIWENFPVTVVPIQSKDNRERYAVQWHNKKYQEARDACEHGWEYMDFEDDTYRRLLKSLSASRFWTVEEATGEYDLCTIAMNFQEDEAAEAAKPAKAFILPSLKEMDSDNENDNESVKTSSTSSSGWKPVGKKVTPVAPSAPTQPVLRRLNDIKTYFPVIWNEVNGCKTTTYAVEIFGKRVKEQGLNMAKVKTDLLAALKVSRSWNVLPAANDRQVCLLQMNHL